MAAKFRGDFSRYVDLATRGKQVLAVGLDYTIHNGVGYLVSRFVAHGEVEVTPFTHFVVRESVQFTGLDEDGKETKKFLGVRLNKVMIPLFQPGPHRASLTPFLIQFSICEKIATWIAKQVIAEGFTLIDVDVVSLVKDLMFVKVPPLESVQEVDITYPNLQEQKEAWIAYLAKKKQAEADDDDDDVEDVQCKHTIN